MPPWHSTEACNFSSIGTMINRFLLFIFFICLTGLDAISQPATDRQKEYLEDILRINTPQVFKGNTRRVSVPDSTWKDWLHRTGELPPDFSKMPSHPFLPEPLVLYKNGKEQPIKTRKEWEEKRNWIKTQYQYWLSGVAPAAPTNLKSTIRSERKEGKTRIEMIDLHFGPEGKASLALEIMIPEGKGPFPVYLTQWDHRNWAQIAVRRGYLAVVYAAADSRDDTEAYQKLYPEYDWTMLMRRAWGASRVVDYLYTRPEINKQQLAITGLSRNGKQSLWAAAFDERITAVIDCSSGTGGITPWRYGDPQFASETLDLVTAYNGHWFHPRLPFFFGREDKLPVDQNLLLSLIAPRILLLHYAIIERGLNPWANEQTYQSVKKVYRFLGAEQNANVFTRFGEHFVNARDIERAIDYLDEKFKRKAIPWENKLYFDDYNFEDWAKKNLDDSIRGAKLSPVKLQTALPDTTAFKHVKTQILDRLKWILGEEPSGVKPLKISAVRDGDWIDNITGRPKVNGAVAEQFGPSFPVSYAMGDFLRGILYYPADKSGAKLLPAGGKRPVVIFLHQYAHSTGFAFGYDVFYRNGNSILFQTLIDKGFAVLAVDLFGYGSRIEEAQYFYQRYPKWSKTGKMLTDVSAYVDALSGLDYIDPGKIFLLGNTLGGNLALMAAAQDNRVAGVAVLSAFSPWRESNQQFESIRSQSHLYGNMPRLGFFATRPKQVPVDYAEIISCIAPRPLLIIAPELDRHADFPAVRNTVEKVKSVYKLFDKERAIDFQTPREINRMTEPMYKMVADFFSVSGKSHGSL